jgi:acyl-CoA thioesterase-1
VLSVGVTAAVAAAAAGMAFGAEADDDRPAPRVGGGVSTGAPVQPGPSASPQVKAPVALFVGDSYTAGSGGAGRSLSFACQTAREMNWTCANDGIAGTGYVQTAGSLGAKGPYYSRVQKPRKGRQPEVVVITGGRNDFPFGLVDRMHAARSTLDRVRSSYPDATIVVVGPFWVDDHPKEALRRFNDGLGAEARKRGMVFLDPIRGRWLTDAGKPRWIARDGVHPTVAGHTRLAEQLVQALKRAGVRPGPAPQG